ncbi:MAG: CHAT domain-containing protein [Bacteroidia bacterium]|nr:CHAT domain-containing protein [Bacteroidia bacterium]
MLLRIRSASLLSLLCLAWAQDLPGEALYFRGKVQSFIKQAQNAYQKYTRRRSSQEREFASAGLAYALALSEEQRYREADSLLRQFLPVLEGGTSISPDIRFRYLWIQGRIKRGLGRVSESQRTFLSANQQVQAPWQRALLLLELAENLLLVGNSPQVVDTLRLFTSFPPFPEPYGSYLQQRHSFLRAWTFWQQGQWDSLPPSLSFSSEHGARYQADYTYLLGLRALFRGEETQAKKALKQSQRWARKTAYRGIDLQLRSSTLLFLHELSQVKPAFYERRIRGLNPILRKFRDPHTPLTYATVEGLEHLREVARITHRNALAENVIGLYVMRGEGILASRLQRVVSRVARSEYRSSIAFAYATQAAQRTAEAAPAVSLEQAQALTELAEAALMSYKYAEADTAFARVLRILHQLGEPEGPLVFPIREALGRRSLQAGRYNQAEEVLRHQRSAYERLLPIPTRNVLYLRNMLFLADLYLRLAQAAISDTILRIMEKPIEDLPPVYLSERIFFHELKGDLAQAKGQFREAEKHYMEAVRLRVRQRKEGKTSEGEESGSLLRLALLYQRTGRLTRAREVYQRITTLYQSSGREDPEVANYYIGLTDFYLLVGDYLKAEEAAKKARDLNQRLQGPISPAYVEALLASARVEQALGRYDKQKAFLSAALQAQEKFYGSKPALPLARTLYLLAENALLQGKKDTVPVLLLRSSDEVERAQASAPLECASLSLDIGGLWSALDSLSLAESRIATAKSVLDAEVPLKHPDRMRAILYQARLKRAQGEYRAALYDYKKWITLWTNLYGTTHPEYPFYLAEMADLYWMARDLSSAKKSYEKSIDLLLMQVDRLFNGLTESEKTRYWTRVRRVLEPYFAFAFSQGTEGTQLKAYEVHLATKAFLLSETAQLRARLARSPDTTVQRIFQEWQDQKEYVVRLYSYSPSELRELGVELSQEEARLNELEKQLTTYIGDIRLKRPTWKQLRSALPPEAAAVDWLRLRLPFGKDSIVYYAVVTTPSLKKPLIFSFPNGKRMETYNLFRYSQSILNFEKDTLSYTAYWQPVIEALPKTVSKLYVSGDGVYYQINPSVLFLPQGGYLVDKYQVVHYSRLASLTVPQKPLKYYEGRKALILADPEYAPGVSPDSLYVPPLPGTAEEAKVIRDILQSEGILPYIRTQEEANELLLQEVISPYILHIATHGLFLPYDEGLGTLIGVQSASALANPLFRSALLLAQAGRSMLYGASDVSRDGIVNAYELLSLRLTNTQLVTLSACETGVGDVQNGEGVYGLQRAFLLAGARNLLLSLWKVDDEATRDFMIHFYSEWLRKKLPIEDAFWNTQRAMRSARGAPYFWGAFILVRP